MRAQTETARREIRSHQVSEASRRRRELNGEASVFGFSLDSAQLIVAIIKSFTSNQRVDENYVKIWRARDNMASFFVFLSVQRKTVTDPSTVTETAYAALNSISLIMLWRVFRLMIIAGK